MTFDTIIQGGTLVTGSWERRGDIGIQGEKIAAIAVDLSGAEAGQRVDAAGKLVIPGFIESHGHFAALGRAKMILDLSGARTWDEVVASTPAAAVSIRERASRTRSSTSAPDSACACSRDASARTQTLGASPESRRLSAQERPWLP